MSDIRRIPVVRNRFELGSSRSTEWSSLRLMVSRDSTDYLTVALVEQARQGHPHLDPRIRGLQVRWFPEYCDYDLRLYAIATALAGVNQTRP